MLIELKNVSKIYKDRNVEFQALRDVNLQIERGEFVAVMGTSGSGKSTLLNIIGCMDGLTDGTYCLDGTDIHGITNKEMAKLRNEIFGFVVQDFALIERYSVEKNVMLPLYYSHKYKKDKKKRVETVLKQLDIYEKRDNLARCLSGGQRQRVAIARALVNGAQIILADEPTGALDQKTGQEVMNLFKQVNEQGKTVIVVTHDPKIAGQCNRIIEIVDGTVLEK